MKKGLLALACALVLGQSAFAQAQEVAYVEDATQGYLFNRFKDNWFITVEGGANVILSHADSKSKFLNRIQPGASIYVGKWFSPLIGVRAGFNWLNQRNVSDGLNVGCDPTKAFDGDYYIQRYMHVGPQFDAMLNITNWWCGYKPNRVYNCIAYVGVGAYMQLNRQYEANGDRTGYKDGKDNVIAARAGLINSFNVCKSFQIALDLRVSAYDKVNDHPYVLRETDFIPQAYLSFTYLFPRREWSAPVVPVCPEPEDCSPYLAALAAAEARIADLEAQLAACLARPTEVVEVAAPAGPLATIYFPIGVSRLTREDKRIVNAVAEIMKANTDTKYVVTGWADNYTGTAAVNDNLRKNRAANVQKQLVKAGVNANQVSTTTNPANLCDMGEKFVALDRAATINIAE